MTPDIPTEDRDDPAPAPQPDPALDSSATVPEPVLPSSSRRLLEARIARGLSQQQIADRLYLTPSRIRHIDEGQFDKIGKRTFLKGYMRSYARELGLSGDEIIALLEEDLGGLAEPVETVAAFSGERMDPQAPASPKRTLWYGVIGIILALGIIWSLNPGPDPAPKPVVRAESASQPVIPRPEPVAEDRFAEPQPEPVPITVSTDSTGQEQAPVNTLTEDEATTADIAAEETEQSAAMDSSWNPELQRRMENGFRVIEVTAPGADQLEFTFTDDCWLEITTMDDLPVYGDLNHARDILRVTAAAPLNVLIGRVSAVSVTFNSEPVDISAHAFNDTAKLVIE